MHQKKSYNTHGKKSYSVLCTIYKITIRKVTQVDIYQKLAFWRVNVLYFVGIGSQPEKTWRHREPTAQEVVVRNHGNGGINNNMAART